MSEPNKRIEAAVERARKYCVGTWTWKKGKSYVLRRADKEYVKRWKR